MYKRNSSSASEIFVPTLSMLFLVKTNFAKKEIVNQIMLPVLLNKIRITKHLMTLQIFNPNHRGSTQSVCVTICNIYCKCTGCEFKILQNCFKYHLRRNDDNTPHAQVSLFHIDPCIFDIPYNYYAQNTVKHSPVGKLCRVAAVPFKVHFSNEA